MSRWQDREESQFHNSWALSQVGFGPCQVPASLRHVQKRPRWMQPLDTLSLQDLIHFLPRTGMEWRGLAWAPERLLFWPVSLSQAGFSAQVCRAIWRWGWLQACKALPRPAAFPWGSPRQCIIIRSSVLPVELWLSKVGATGPPHQSGMMGHTLGAQWVPQTRRLLSQLQSLQVLQGHVVTEVILILGKKGTLSPGHPPEKGKQE